MLHAFSPDQNPALASPGVSALDVCQHDEHHALGTWRNVVIVVWRKDTQIPAVQRTSALIGQAAKRHRELALLQIIEKTAIPPEADIRKAISQMLKGHAGQVTCSAVVFEGDGFRAAGVRGVVTAINLLSRTPFPHVIFASSLAAINWTARHLSTDGPIWVEHARNAVEGLRSVIDHGDLASHTEPQGDARRITSPLSPNISGSRPLTRPR